MSKYLPVFVRDCNNIETGIPSEMSCNFPVTGNEGYSIVESSPSQTLHAVHVFFVRKFSHPVLKFSLLFHDSSTRRW